MIPRSARSLPTLALLVAAVAACDGAGPATGSEPPFDFDVLAAVDGEPADRVDPGQTVTVGVGQDLELFVQVIDARGRSAPVQRGTIYGVSNTTVLVPVADFIDDDQGRREIVFRAISAGNATVQLLHQSVHGPRLVIVRVE